MFRVLAGWILGLAGWEISGTVPEGVEKCVVVVAPHTSNWDFVIGRLAYTVLGLPARFLIKKEWFFFPLGPLLKSLGGIPVDRKSDRHAAEKISALFARRKRLFLTITPEGTRKYNAHWKRGFYTIALRAKVPIALGFLDYREKKGGIRMIIYPTGNFREDFRIIEDFYRGIHARHPKKFNLS
ncbi:MAG: 1-acyl-sn-glycerol-3-phosphate acyltransferase [Bacteroidales bacterium]|nr:1-acyl-sn-glycerol-3-phosphate acyltransferase [Bacteroidales bacterium]